MNAKRSVKGFGLIIIGNEILDGRRNDAHFAYTRDLLRVHKLDCVYTLILPDQMQVLVEQLKWAMSQPIPFFCCGGIGSTPDDLTRQAAAEAGGVATERHTEGAALLKQRFGPDQATELRLRMVDFPAGATLIPNPVNQVPGFSFANGHFFPGFPEMTQPMMKEILENYYEVGGEKIRCTLHLPGAKEADLVLLMEAFIQTYPELGFSSLPRFTEDGGTEVILGLNGAPQRVEQGKHDLIAELASLGVPFYEGECETFTPARTCDSTREAT